MPSQDWFCAQNDFNTDQFIYGVNPSTHQIIWTEDLNLVAWSLDSEKVQNLIANNNLSNVSTVAKGGNHPPRPPLP
jgi:hypothetical protein